MTQSLHIISSCVIADNTVMKNDEAFFSAKDINLQSFLLQLYKYIKADYPKFYKMDNLSKLGWLASEILIKDEALIKQYKPEDIGLLITNANASLDADVRYFQTIEMASPALFVYTLPNILIGEICIRNKFKGENACFVFEDFNAAFIKEYVEALFADKKLKLCICGWVDVLDDDYKAALFLVAEQANEASTPFIEGNINEVFNKVV